MAHHVQMQHLYSCDGTCTSDDLHRSPSSLVAFHTCYHLDHVNIYEISARMTRLQCTIWCIHSVWKHYFTVYCMWWWPLMTYVYYAYSWPLYYYVSGTSMYASYLQSYVEIHHCIVLTSHWFFDLGLHYSAPKAMIMYFFHHVPLWPHTLGDICYSVIFHT